MQEGVSILETIRDRVCTVFYDSGLSQTDFAKKINVTSAYVWKLLNKENATPSERLLNDICQEFNINEAWLLTGNGDMRLPQNRISEIAEFTAELFHANPDSFKSRFLSALASLDEEDWDLLEKIVKKITLSKTSE